MSLKLIGAGLGRTGTLSLKAALERLGFAPCYHMIEVLTVPDRVTVRKVDLGQELQILAYHELRKTDQPVLAGPSTDAALVRTAGGES